MGRKGISRAIVGHALVMRMPMSARTVTPARLSAASSERSGHDASAARLQTLPGALQDRDVSILGG